MTSLAHPSWVITHMRSYPWLHLSYWKWYQPKMIAANWHQTIWKRKQKNDYAILPQASFFKSFYFLSGDRSVVKQFKLDILPNQMHSWHYFGIRGVMNSMSRYNLHLTQPTEFAWRNLFVKEISDCTFLLNNQVSLDLTFVSEISIIPSYQFLVL